MSTWTEGEVPVRRSSRRLSSVPPPDVVFISSTFSTPAKEGQRTLLQPKSSLIPRLKQVEENMSSEDEVLFVPATETKRGRGRPRKNSPARPKMTAIKTPASSVAAVKEAAAAVAPSVKKEKTPPRSRSSSRTRRAAWATPSSSPIKKASAAATLPKIPPVISFEDSPVVTRRSTRLASTKTTASNGSNGHANGSSVHEATAAETKLKVDRFSTQKWADDFTDNHPIITKIFIPAIICLAYALVIIGVCAYFDIHKKAPQWMDQVAQNINDMYDDFMARRAAASAATAADQI